MVDGSAIRAGNNNNNNDNQLILGYYIKSSICALLYSIIRFSVRKLILMLQKKNKNQLPD